MMKYEASPLYLREMFHYQFLFIILEFCLRPRMKKMCTDEEETLTICTGRLMTYVIIENIINT